MKIVLLHMVPAVLISFIMHFILHELGHLVGGLLTGWRFLYLQIYNLVLRKEDKGYKIMVVGEKGFRCIMYPDTINNNALLYTMGGCIVNLTIGVIGLSIILIVHLSPIMWLYLWCLSVFGFGMFIMNGTASIKRLCNDKACYKLIKADSYTRICHNSQLLMAKHLMKGLTYGEINKELICLSPDMAENDIQAYQVVLEYYYYLDIGDYEEAGQALKKVMDTNNASRDVSNIIEHDNFYFQLIKAFRNSNIEYSNVLNIKLRNYINVYSKKEGLHSLRIRAAYEAFIQLGNGDNKAVNILDMAIENLIKIPCIYEGERIFCIKQLKGIKNMISG